MKLFTIGFTKKSAEEFFTHLQNAGVRRIVDIRLNNTSQIAGFAKARDLKYFLHTIAGIDYVHIPDFAPTKSILDAYKKKEIDWEEYERQFRELITERQIENLVTREQINNACFLCSEVTHEKCHRRLVVEYLQGHWRDVVINHL